MATEAKRRPLRLFIGIAVTALLLALCWYYLDWQLLARQFADSDPQLLALSFALYALVYPARALRFSVLASTIPFRLMLAVTCVHSLLLRLLPLRTGELSYPVLLKRAGGADLGEGLVMLVLVRIVDLAVVVVMFGVALAIYGGEYRASLPLALAAAAGLSLLGALAIFHFTPLWRASLRLCRGVARATRLDRSARVRTGLDRLDAAVACCSDLSLRRMVELSAATAMQWLLLFAVIYFLMRAFAVPVSVGQAVLGGTGAIVTGLLPIGLVGSFGTLEAGWVLGFSLAGVPTEIAVASALGYSLATLAFAAALGIPAWFALAGATRTKNKEREMETGNGNPI